MRMHFLRRSFVAAAIAWAGALAGASWAASHARLAPAAYAASAVVYLIGSLVCHQRPERSFQLWGAQMPVCARCTGIYVGAAIAALVWLARRGPWDLLRTYVARDLSRATSGGQARTALMLAATPAAVTLVYEWTTGHVPANWLRALTGLPIGLVVSWVVTQPEVN